MYRLSLILILLISVFLLAMDKNPHGSDFKMDCAKCHDPSGWKVNLANVTYDHGESGFTLEGRHLKTDCRSCHPTLIFKEAEPGCIACHTDVHNMTVGNDCGRCHKANNWLVNNIPEIHEENGFPLVSQHATASCADCHKSSNTLEWSRIGNDCIDCHRADYSSASNPNHLTAGFSFDCTECHEPFSRTWGGKFAHFFFPLNGGHDNVACASCHKNPDYKQIDPDCFACHQPDYGGAVNPNHQQMGFPTDCALCHDLTPGWKPASYGNHDAEFFPIYTGKHQGEWTTCTDCHTNPSNFALFSCIDCHEHNNAADLANKHNGVPNYQYNSQACLDCHPDGSE